MLHLRHRHNKLYNPAVLLQIRPVCTAAAAKAAAAAAPAAGAARPTFIEEL